jgi:hypothetical protein
MSETMERGAHLFSIVLSVRDESYLRIYKGTLEIWNGSDFSETTALCVKPSERMCERLARGR